MKKILSLCLVLIFCLGTVANAQEITGTGFSNIPVSYSQSSTFTVVMPDSFELDSTKKQDFQIYLSDYDLIDGEQVKVTPTTNTITMENQIVEIPYLVSSEATSYQGMAEFPEYEGFVGFDGVERYKYFDDYILTKTISGEYYLYCFSESITKIYVNRYNEEPNITRYEITNEPSSYALSSFSYNKSTNSWVTSGIGFPKISDTETIIQSTVPIYDGLESEEAFVQYSKTVKDPVDITITMESNLMSDSTPINGTIEGPDLSSGEWLGEVVFEISLVK